jgi:hypothetical protein
MLFIYEVESCQVMYLLILHADIEGAIESWLTKLNVLTYWSKDKVKLL